MSLLVSLGVLRDHREKDAEGRAARRTPTGPTASGRPPYAAGGPRRAPRGGSAAPARQAPAGRRFEETTA
jgi:hypothetical protein